MNILKISLLLCVSVAIASCTPPEQETEKSSDDAKMDVRETSIGTLQFNLSFPTEETSKLLKKERRSQRAIQTYIWAIPIASMADYLYTFTGSLGYKMGDFFRINADYYDDLRWGITANGTTDYILGWIDTDMGPWVIDVPEGPTAGFINDMWQRPVVDLGIPGVNNGKGGKHLILGPNTEVPEGAIEAGFDIARSPSRFNTLVHRSFFTEDEEAEAYFQIFKLLNDCLPNLLFIFRRELRVLSAAMLVEILVKSACAI